MPKYEYHWEENIDPEDREDTANKLGEQEWELIYETQGTYSCTLAFKREKRVVAPPTKAGPLGGALELMLTHDPIGAK